MEPWAWLALLGLGAFHGLNPAMGWLFAVALGLQRKDRRLVALAVVPLALGHAAAIVLALLALAVAGRFLHAPALHWLAGGLLVAWGVWHLAAGHRYRLRVGMTTGMAGLALWSFAMATAHGAGLMLAPVALEGAALPAHHVHGEAGLGHAPSTAAIPLVPMLGAVAVHTLAMAAAALAVALAVYHWVGLAILRTAWVNLDWLWAGALIAAGALLFVL